MLSTSRKKMYLLFIYYCFPVPATPTFRAKIRKPSNVGLNKSGLTVIGARSVEGLRGVIQISASVERAISLTLKINQLLTMLLIVPRPYSIRDGDCFNNCYKKPAARS